MKENPKKYFTKTKTLKNIPLIQNSCSESQMLDDNNEELCLLKYLVNKTGPKKYCRKHETLKNTSFIWQPKKIQIFEIQNPKKYSADPCL